MSTEPINLMHTAGEIAQFVFGSKEPKYVRVIYHWADSGKMPIFKVGDTLCASPATLRKAIEKLERGETANASTTA